MASSTLCLSNGYSSWTKESIHRCRIRSAATVLKKINISLFVVYVPSNNDNMHTVLRRNIAARSFVMPQPFQNAKWLAAGQMSWQRRNKEHSSNGGIQ